MNPTSCERSRASAYPMHAASTASKVGRTSTRKKISKAIGDGTWREKYSPQEILDYCEEDGTKSVQLLRRQFWIRAAPTSTTFVTGRTTAPNASPASRRAVCPSTSTLWDLVQEHKAAVIRRIDPTV